MAASVAAAGAAAGAAAVSAPFVSRAAASEPLRVGTFGGYFQDSFDKHIYPDFTKDTGIRVESVGESTSEAWLVRLETAARTGEAPADVSMLAQVPRLKGQNRKLWAPLDEAGIPHAKNLPDHFVHRYGDGSISGIGAVSWYITLVTNTHTYPQAPESWKTLWDPANKGRIGLLALVSNSFLLEITAAAWFGSSAILDTEEGIVQVMGKLAEIKPNVRLWYRDEGQFQRALETGEIPMGQHYHDVTWLAAAAGKPPPPPPPPPPSGPPSPWKAGFSTPAPGASRRRRSASTRRRSSSTTCAGLPFNRSCRGRWARRRPSSGN